MDIHTLEGDVHVELKKADKGLPKDFWPSYSAFANTDGGDIYLGIEQIRQGENVVNGIANPAQMKKSIEDQLHEKNKVSVNLLEASSIETREEDGKTYLVVHVRKASALERPVYLKGNIGESYKRGYEGDYHCSPEEIQSMRLERLVGGYDSQRNPRFLAMEDVDLDSLHAYRSLVEAHTSLHSLHSLTDQEFLDRVGGFVRDEEGRNWLSNAAVLMFTNQAKIQQIYGQYLLDYQEQFSGKSRHDYRLVSDDLSFSGNVFDFFMRAGDRLVSGIPNRFSLQGMEDVGGKDMAEALREALVNALCNCDYLTGGVKVIKQADRIEITNKGSIKVGLSQALRGGVSLPRNPSLMTYFRYIGYAERKGEGVPSVFEVCRENDLKEPILKEIPEIDSTVFTILLVQDPSALEKGPSKALLQALGRHPEGRSLKELAVELGWSNSKVQKALAGLRQKGLVHDNGKPTNGRKYFA